MFNFEVNNDSGIQDDPYGLNWATDPVDGDPYFNFDWQGNGIPVNPFGNSDLGTLWKELEAMQNTNGAGDNLPEIIATIIQIGKNPADASDPAVQAFFQNYGPTLISQLIDSELLLVYSQNIGSPPNPANAEAAMAAFGNSLLNGPLKGIGAGDSILGPMVSEITSDISPAGLAQLRSEFWVQNSDGSWTFQIPAGAGNPSPDGHPINLNGADGPEIFAEYVFGDILYGGTFGDSKFANATNDLFLTMFMSVLAHSKDPIYLFMALMTMFGSFKDENYQNELQGYGYTSNWLSKQQDQLQKLINEYNTPGFFTDANGNPVIDPKTGVSNAVEWMDGVRRLLIDAAFNPYAKSMMGNISSSVGSIFGTMDPKETDEAIGFDYFMGQNTALAVALNQLSQGVAANPTSNPPTPAIAPDTAITDNMQTLTKTFTDRSQSIQTQMSSVSSNDNTVVNTLKTALSNITQLEQSINSQLAQANN